MIYTYSEWPKVNMVNVSALCISNLFTMGRQMSCGDVKVLQCLCFIKCTIPCNVCHYDLFKLIIILPANKVWRYIGIVSVFLSVCATWRKSAKIVYGLYLSYGETLEFLNFTQILHMTFKYVMILTQSHLGKFKITGRKRA